MKLEAIPVPKSDQGAADSLKTMRNRGPEYLKTLVEELHGIEGLNSLSDLGEGDVIALAGGNMSVDYAIPVNGRWVVVKFRSAGAEAEAETLRAWRQAGASVVKVFNSGTLPKIEGQEREVKFLVLQAAMDEQNDLAETGKEYIKRHPGATYEIAVQMGRVLAAMHRAKASHPFGEFADMWGSEEGKPPMLTWNDYLLGYVEEHHDDLMNWGFTPLKIENLKRSLAALKFPEQGVYLHGDFSSRNAMIVAKDPYRVEVLDPNPLIGDPSWDLAVLYNNEEFERRKLDHDLESGVFRSAHQIAKEILEGVLEGYEQAGGEKIEPKAIAASQLMQCMYLFPGKEKRAKKEGREPVEDIQAMVVKDTLSDKLELLAY